MYHVISRLSCITFNVVHSHNSCHYVHSAVWTYCLPYVKLNDTSIYRRIICITNTIDIDLSTASNVQWFLRLLCAAVRCIFIKICLDFMPAFFSLTVSNHWLWKSDCCSSPEIVSHFWCSVEYGLQRQISILYSLCWPPVFRQCASLDLYQFAWQLHPSFTRCRLLASASNQDVTWWKAWSRAKFKPVCYPRSITASNTCITLVDNSYYSWCKLNSLKYCFQHMSSSNALILSYLFFTGVLHE